MSCEDKDKESNLATASVEGTAVTSTGPGVKWAHLWSCKYVTHMWNFAWVIQEVWGFKATLFFDYV